VLFRSGYVRHFVNGGWFHLPIIKDNLPLNHEYIWNEDRESYDLYKKLQMDHLTIMGRVKKGNKRSKLFHVGNLHRLVRYGDNNANIQLLKRQKFIEQDRFSFPAISWGASFDKREWGDEHNLFYGGYASWKINDALPESEYWDEDGKLRVGRGGTYFTEDVTAIGPHENECIVLKGDSGTLYVYDKDEEAFWNINQRFYTTCPFSLYKRLMKMDKKIQEAKTATRIFATLKAGHLFTFDDDGDSRFTTTAYVLVHP